jgi:hypothetical protein
VCQSLNGVTMTTHRSEDVPSANRRNQHSHQSWKDNVQCTQHKCLQLRFMFLRQISSVPPNYSLGLGFAWKEWYNIIVV